jgi:ribosomal protein L32
VDLTFSALTNTRHLLHDEYCVVQQRRMSSLGDIARGLVGVLSDSDEAVRDSASSGLLDICRRSPDVGLGACVDFLAEGQVDAPCNSHRAAAASTSQNALEAVPVTGTLSLTHRVCVVGMYPNRTIV